MPRCRFLLLFLAFAFSCKKDKDAVKPVITVLSPTENQAFTMGADIPVKLEVKDDVRLEYVIMQINTPGQVAASAPVTRHPADKSAILEETLKVTDLQLQAGDYYLYVRASDGVNESTYHRKIYLSAAPRYRRAIYFVSTPGAYADVYRVDSLFSKSPAYQANGDLSGFQVSSEDQQVYSAGLSTGKLEAHSAYDQHLLWQENNMGAGTPYFTGLFYSKHSLYVSFYDGHIRGYLPDKQIAFNASTNPGSYYPLKLSMNDSYLLAEEKAVVGPLRQLSVYYAATGGWKQSAILTSDVVGIFTKDVDNSFVFSNENGQGKILLYNLSQNGFWSPHSMTQLVYDACQVDENTYLLSCPNGIYRYRYNTNSLLLFIPAVKAQRIRYDDVNGEVIAASNTNINLYDYGTGSLKNTIAHTDSVIDIQILYNR